jgi:acetoacetyl-CoA synthetase
LLCLLDTYVDERYLPWPYWLRFQYDYVGRRWRALSGLQRDKQTLYISHKLSAAVDRIRMRFGYLARNPAANTVGLPATLLLVREAMRVAMMNYRPRPYRASPVHYLRADIAQEEQGDPLPVWTRVAERGLVVADVHGSHTGILLEANVPYAALVLDRVLSGEVQLQAH